ncbi:hypothetical protein [Thalassotalea castellviae]|uniref:Uncharacterized protein n=1 Tax=Thalassotalea castellviae TaxID=3075612 RepID=A0ABU3A0L5_9GAMM|nr:hypothetical protein [Thalassotalea sp. W431]MDT0603480.1 hypothetical protein [Thalassotalea sp. W431]
MDKSLLIMLFTQLVSAVAVIYSNRTEISWIKQIQQQQHERITTLENNK